MGNGKAEENKSTFAYRVAVAIVLDNFHGGRGDPSPSSVSFRTLKINLPDYAELDCDVAWEAFEAAVSQAVPNPHEGMRTYWNPQITILNYWRLPKENVNRVVLEK